MRNCRTAFLAVFCVLTNAQSLHEPPVGSPVFIRSAVESVPQHHAGSLMMLAYSRKPTYGEAFLPLRSAVESSPSIRFSERLPLRDAVEYRPSNNLRRTARDTSPVEGRGFYPAGSSQRYEAFSIPSHYESEPQPFRVGSPFQELVDFQKISTYVTQYDDPQIISALKEQEIDGQKVFCHMTNWALYRQGDGKFVPENLDSNLCTHILYSFGSLDPETLTLKEFDVWADIDNGLYKRAMALDIPVILALGGWTDSTGDKYSRLVSNRVSRSKFISGAVSFLTSHGFKGLHIDWNYPKCWQSNCKKGPDSDKPNFTKLVKELKTEFMKYDLQLGVAISGYKEVINVAYEMNELTKYVDYFTVMTYDYHGGWESQTGHVSPLYGRTGDKYPQYNTDYTMRLLVELGADREKLIMGVPLYGQTFTLTQTRSGSVGEGVNSEGPGDAGEFTRQPGMLSYYEICTRIKKQKWQTGRDSSGKSGPYASYGDQWVGYEDAKSITAKGEYVINSGFGGIAAWTVDLDDFKNKCCDESFPLLRAINRVLGRLKTSAPAPGNCSPPPEPVTPVAPVLTTPSGDDGGIHEHSSSWSKPTETTTWPAWSKPTAAVSTTTTEHSTTAVTWWPPATTKTTTTSERPTTTRRTTTTTERPTTTERTTTTRRTTRRTTTERPTTEQSTWWPTSSSTLRPSTSRPSTTIPFPAIVMPVEHEESCEAGEYRAHETNCNYYYRCVRGILVQQSCSGGLYWNRNQHLCDWPASAKCTTEENVYVPIKQTTTRRPIPTTTTTRRTTPATRRTTTTTRRTTTRTPTTTTRRTTTTPRRTTYRPTSARPTYAATTKKPIQPTTCNSGEYYPHEDCSSFYICVNNYKLSQRCPAGLQWNKKTNACDYKNNVRCVSTIRYLRLVKSGATLNNPCNGDTNVPYPGKCNKYLICQWGSLHAADCPPGLNWNQGIKNCDWPANARCVSDGTENETDLEEEEEETDKENEIEEFIPEISPPEPVVEEEIEENSAEPLSGHYKVVCYFTNWAWYRKGAGKYVPEDIDTDLCTHIVYGFAVLDYSELVVRTHDSWADIDNKFYARVVAMKAKGAKVSLAIGGWNDSQGDKYSRLVRSAAARAKFIKHISGFIEKHEFDGLDLDWEYPVCWQVDCKKGFPDEKEGFAALVRELSNEFKPRGWLLSSAVSPSKKVIDAGYDVPTLAKYFDWIAVMTYDFHGQWDKKTGHVAPLFYHPDDDVSYFNANFSMNYWIEQGAPSRKLIMGMPLYGQSFTLSDAKSNGLNAHAPGPGTAGEFTRAAGFLAYYEICDRVQNRGWNIVKDNLARMGPYAYKGNQWVSYDDKETLKRKSQLIRSLNLGGGMIWALDLDDFKNRCGQGKHPLLKAIVEVLRDPPSSNEVAPTIRPEIPEVEVESEVHPEVQPEVEQPIVEEPEPIVEEPEQPETSLIDIDNPMEGSESKPEETIGDPDEFKVVCYFTNWAWYRQSGGKYVPEDIDADLCSHVVYGFAVLNRDTLTISPHDSWADIDNNFYERVVALKKKGIKVNLAIGGWNDSAGDKYSRLVRSAAARARFVKHVIEFIEKYGFDGLDLDWEYPVCWQVDCSKGIADEKEGFVDLVRELSDEFRPRGWLLSSAVSPSQKVIDAAYDVPALSDLFDWIAVMAYDFHGQWDKQTGHVAPMYEHEDDFDMTFNANYSLNYWISEGADRKKLIMGMPMYGQSFSLADNGRNTLNSPTYGGGEAGEATRARGFLAYYEICENIIKKGWKVVRDPRGRMGPYGYLRDQWVSFDDAAMIQHKSEYVRAMGLGGAMIWALDLDDFRNVCDCETYPLLKTINRVLRNYPGPHANCKLEDVAEFADEEVFVEEVFEEETPTTKKPKLTTTTTRRTTTARRTTTKPKTTKRPTYASTTEKPTRPSVEAVLSEGEESVPCKNRMFAPHTDCNKYYHCQYDVLMEQNCPQGLHWNKDHCDWPQNANCGQISEQTTKRPSYGSTKKPTKKPTKRPSKKPVQKPTRKPTKKPIQEIQPVVSDDSEYKVVCYFTNWAWYRQGDGKYSPDNIDENLCTHIVYGFAVLNGESLTIRTHDSWADIDNRFYEKVVALKAKGVRVTLAIGGWNDSLGDKYSRLVQSAAARARFIEHVTEFLEKYEFEGLDLDWEYPVCWQVDCKKGSPEEKEGFANLVKELAAEFRPRGWLLSAAVSPSKMVIDAAYDVPTLAEYFDWIAVMTYDFHGHWDKQTGHVAPLYYVPGDTYDYFNANYSMNYWMELGAPSKKLIMGMPLYGQSFSLADATKRGLNEKSYGPGEAGQFTRAGGFLAYYEICEKVNTGGWEVVRDEEGRIGPYAYSGNQWVSYDDVSDIRRKAQFLKSLNLGGGMVWALDLDDFRGRCGCGNHPLLRTLNQELRGLGGQRSVDCT